MDIMRLLELAGTENHPEDDAMMKRAIDQAHKASKLKCAPIGAVIVSKKGEKLIEAHNEVALDKDPTAHAEIMAIRKAGAKHGIKSLKGATLYSTLQPCGMCTMACYWAGISRIVYGATDETVNTLKYFETNKMRTQQFVDDMHESADIAVASGVLAEECTKLYKK